MSGADFALLLLFGGVIGIYTEFCLPGKIVPGVTGSVLTLLGISRLWAFPLDWRGALLIAIGFLCFVLEARFSTRGLLASAGALALLLGSITLIDKSRTAVRIHPSVAAAITIPFAVFSSFLFSIAMRARRNKLPIDILKEQKAKRNHDSVG